MAPTHFRIADLSGVEPKPPVLWIRGANDVIVSDTSLYDLAYLGSLGAIPGWPGEQTWPPQPMVAQTRAVLNGYAVASGRTARRSSRTRVTARTWTSRSCSWPS